jgi:hypothetical protein
MSEHDTYVIRATQKGWVLLLNGQTIGTFESRPEAEQAALTGMDISRQCHKAAELFCQEKDGEPNLISKTRTGLIGDLALGPDPADAR